MLSVGFEPRPQRSRQLHSKTIPCPSGSALHVYVHLCVCVSIPSRPYSFNLCILHTFSSFTLRISRLCVTVFMYCYICCACVYVQSVSRALTNSDTGMAIIIDHCCYLSRRWTCFLMYCYFRVCYLICLINVFECIIDQKFRLLLLSTL